jgi:NitT/TauT family transport system permease protein
VEGVTPASSRASPAIEFETLRDRGLGVLRLTRLRGSITSLGFGLLGMAILLAIWFLAAAEVGPLRLPNPWLVAVAILQNWQSIPALQYIIMQPGGLGDSLTYTICGALAGIVLPYVAPLRLVLTPLLIVLGTTPVLILLPFLVEWFGNGRWVMSGLVVVFTFVVITTMTMNSLANAAGRYRDYARSLGAGPGFEMIHVAFPALIPDLVSAVRISLAAAWSLQTVAELIGGKPGAGRIIGVMANVSNTTIVLAMVVCLATAAVIIDGVFVLLAMRVQRWKP